MRLRLLFAISLIMIFSALATAQHGQPPNYYIPYHIYDTQTKQWIDLESMLAATAQNEVLFLGEQHNDTFGHRLELAIVQGVFRRRPNLVIAMEMFERDAQPAINDYFANQINETEFLSRSRPWPNYFPDYRPIVEFARSNKLTLVGSNAPQRLARAVAQNGIEIVERFPSSDRPYVAAQVEYPHDDYWQRFTQTMMGMMGHGHGQPAANADNPHNPNNPHEGTTEASPNPHNPHESATQASPNPHNPHEGATEAQPAVSQAQTRIEHFYQAQVLKDETMGESIANILKEREAGKPFVIHINGDFHSAYREGTAARAKRRLPNARIKHISIVPVSNLDKIDVDEYLTQGDYLIFTLQQQRDE